MSQPYHHFSITLLYVLIKVQTPDQKMTTASDDQTPVSLVHWGRNKFYFGLVNERSVWTCVDPVAVVANDKPHVKSTTATTVLKLDSISKWQDCNRDHIVCQLPVSIAHLSGQSVIITSDDINTFLNKSISDWLA
jgi:hypothetical protein